MKGLVLQTAPTKRLPKWLRRDLPRVSATKTHDILGRYGLNTVCESAMCPNRTECYSRNTSTFMILGNVCTRSCGFCNIEAGKPETVMEDEPERVAQAAKALGLHYIVITAVARDDLHDQGAGHFARTIRAVREQIKDAEIEVLTPDFHARRDLIQQVVEAQPLVFNHNVETVPRLQKQVRKQANFERSLDVLKCVKSLDANMYTKSGIMLGLGETEREVVDAAKRLREVGCDILTIGQYLRPSLKHLEVQKYFEPEYFDYLKKILTPLGFKDVFAGPYVRSSYHAGEVFHQTKI